mmetsp:Transcript_29007/g.69934  ORF Transcript_29007/g.69934 Transcript_29007/m.69934 type:complete len:284 (-) Transcript_29007:862-1713(-)
MNHCVSNLYQNGVDRIDRHSDKDLDLNREDIIVSVSLGSSKVMEVRDRREPYAPGSMFVLGPYTNVRFTHTVLPLDCDEENGEDGRKNRMASSNEGGERTGGEEGRRGRCEMQRGRWGQNQLDVSGRAHVFGRKDKKIVRAGRVIIDGDVPRHRGRGHLGRVVARGGVRRQGRLHKGEERRHRDRPGHQRRHRWVLCIIQNYISRQRRRYSQIRPVDGGFITYICPVGDECRGNVLVPPTGAGHDAPKMGGKGGEKFLLQEVGEWEQVLNTKKTARCQPGYFI